MMRFVYVHGFASSPHSRKAEGFRMALFAAGRALDIPEMDNGDFRGLTISGQLAVLARTLDCAPACLIGSSMGGYLAALYASSHPEVERLVLLAPAFGFASRWQATIAGKYTNRSGPEAFEVFHYGEKRMREVGYALIDDALCYPPAPAFSQPALIFHGVHDDVAPIGVRGHSHPLTRMSGWWSWTPITNS